MGSAGGGRSQTAVLFADPRGKTSHSCIPKQLSEEKMLQPVEDAIRRRSDRAKHAQGCAQSQRPKCQSNASEDVECDLDSIGKLLDENCDSQKGHSEDGHEDRNEENLKLKQILR